MGTTRFELVLGTIEENSIVRYELFSLAEDVFIVKGKIKRYEDSFSSKNNHIEICLTLAL